MNDSHIPYNGQSRLAAHLEQIREEERTRISRELHDELGQSLTALKFGLATASAALGDTQLPGPAQGVSRHLHQLSANVDEIIKSVRRIATQLRPPILDTLGLVAALEWQVEEFSKLTGIAVCFENKTDDLPINQHQTTALFRATQELLTNVARHADAQNVRVRLCQSSNRIELEVADDGVGLTEEISGSTGSLGLLGVKERVSAVDGIFRIVGSAEGGTHAHVVLPLIPSTNFSKEAP